MKGPQPHTDMPQRPSQPQVCPFVRAPMAECYCSSLSSLNTYYVSKFCCGDYRSCKIYAKHQ